jgi:uncharacterized membrane protein
MKRKKALFICLMILGAALVCVSGFVLKDESLKRISGVCAGFGGGLFGVALTQFITIRRFERNPEVRRRMEIDGKDERMIRINDRARSRAFAIVEVLYAILAMVLILMGVELIVVLLVIGVFVIGWVIYFMYAGKYAKEM